MTDRIHDAAHNDLAKRAENAEREAVRWKRCLASVVVAALAIMSALVMVNGSSEVNAIRIARARDAAQAQSQIYLDGWKQCVSSGGRRPWTAWERADGHYCYVFTDGSEDCSDGSLFDPMRRIDR